MQQKLVESVLYHEKNILEYFFEDKNGKNRANKGFIIAIVTQLVSVLYEPGEIIIPAQ